MTDKNNRKESFAGGCCGPDFKFPQSMPEEMSRMMEKFCGEGGSLDCSEMMEKFRGEDGSIDCGKMMEMMSQMFGPQKEKSESK